ncbi:MAG: hypothetical protein PWQ70_2118 [Clostridiales bacterium]|nr:hypothetical protein [Clostridiales bacterium]
MHKVLFDCDNTMGVKGCDVDDGLTLLYLLGRQDIDLLGVTTTFGNSTIDIVHENTVKMFNDLNIHAIPLYKGAGSKHNRQSDASRFLVKMAQKYPGEISLLATGSLTNLYGAYESDKDFFHNLKEVVLMGGITQPLVINNKNLNELNFSCDPEASYHVLSANTKVTVLTGHICLQAFFGEYEFKRLMHNRSLKIFRYIKDKSLDWYHFIMNEFGINGFYNWDIVAAVYITNPELFDDNPQKLTSTSEDLKTGMLKIDNFTSQGYEVNIPTTIKDINKFNEIIFNTWENVKII